MRRENPSDRSQPPQWLLRFFRWFCHPECVEDIEGDLLERFDLIVESHGEKKARRKFAWETLRLFRPGIIRPIDVNTSSIRPAMIRHNLLISYRGILQDKSTFLINLTGLSTGLACVLLIYLWVQDERLVDAFHEKDEQLYQVRSHRQLPSGYTDTWDIMPALLGEALKEQFPEVEEATQFSSEEENPRGVFSYGDQGFPAQGIYAASNFFEVFSFPLLIGDSKNVLADKGNIVISEALAQKWFSSPKNAIGKTIEWEHPFLGGVFKVSGVFQDLPSNTTEKFDLLLSLEVFLDAFDWAREWNGSSVETFLLLKKGTDIARFNERISPFFKDKSPDENIRRNTLFVQQYSHGYLYNRFENGKLTGGRIDYVYLFTGIGLFILLIACINFMNLSTARASTKMKQIGVKKTLGITRKSLINQFLCESTLITLLSGIIALVWVALFIPTFNQITGKDLVLTFETQLILPISLIILITGFIAGSYPAFYLSSLAPISILKGKFPTSLGELLARKGMVVLQFTLSILFIVGVLVIHEQMDYTLNKNLGYSRDHVMHFKRQASDYDPEVFLGRLKDIPGVIQTTQIASGSIINNPNKGTGFSWSGQESEADLMFLRPQVGYDFVETLGLELIAGRSFARTYGDETSKLLVNEAAAELIGRKNIIGRVINDGDFEKEIVGVVKNFHIKSLHEEIEPCIIRFSPRGRDVMVKIQSGREQETIEAISQIFKEFHPSYPFTFGFLDDEYERLYASEIRVASLSKYFSLLAIIISCLGLFGLATFTAEQRKKEIGIRKVLGASVRQLIQLLSADYTKMVLLSIAIAIPIAITLTHLWLQGFAYKIPLKGWLFVLATASTFLIAALTVSIQTYRAASVNPVECLKDE
ncbi:MAG: ABC transporter permease [Bacteroidota bacterium]